MIESPFELDAKYEVEFLTLDGKTVAIAIVPRSHLRPVTHRGMTHARSVEIWA